MRTRKGKGQHGKDFIKEPHRKRSTGTPERGGGLTNKKLTAQEGKMIVFPPKSSISREVGKRQGRKASTSAWSHDCRGKGEEFHQTVRNHESKRSTALMGEPSLPITLKM